MFNLFKKKNSKKDKVDKAVDNTQPDVTTHDGSAESSQPSKTKRDPARYEEEKRIAHSDDTGERLNLAQSTETHQEILYYMAENDPDPDVRKAVALNHTTPVHASTVLAADKNQNVRLALAERLVDLLPDLSNDQQSQLYAYAVQSLATLALDEVIKIRKALSSTLKDQVFAPQSVVGQLARDVEREVAEPVLRFCIALSDEDLLDILKAYHASWAVQAIASRESVSEAVSEAVIETEDVPGGKCLLENEGAKITEDLLKKIVSKAREFPEWQAPVATRHNLSADIARKLAEFADESIRKILIGRQDFDEATVQEVSEVFQRRLSFATEKKASQVRKEDPVILVEKLAKEGKLNDDTISDAVGMRDADFVHAAFAHIAGESVDTIAKIFGMRASKAIVALCWHCKLSMRTALQLQRDFAKVHPKEILYPKEGTDYPLTEDEMRWQLDFLGIETK